MAVLTSLRCPQCGGPMPPAKRVGRPRRFCGNACRYRAREDRRKAGIPPMPRRPRPTTELEPLPDDVVLFSPPAPSQPLEAFAEALTTLREVSVVMTHLVPELAPTLAWRLRAFLDELQDALERHLGPLL